jgi:hypothetical protein
MRAWLFLAAFFLSLPALALSKEAKEFMKIAKELEPVHCEKRRLTRAIALAEIEKRPEEVHKLRTRLGALDKDKKTAQLEKRLAQLGPVLERSPDPEDLPAINRQRVEAFYRCE